MGVVFCFVETFDMLGVLVPESVRVIHHILKRPLVRSVIDDDLVLD